MEIAHEYLQTYIKGRKDYEKAWYGEKQETNERKYRPIC